VLESLRVSVGAWLATVWEEGAGRIAGIETPISANGLRHMITARQAFSTGYCSPLQDHAGGKNADIWLDCGERSRTEATLAV
jgi:hypothetical protein